MSGVELPLFEASAIGSHVSKSPYTRSGTRRAGDDYQDMVALDLLVEMLEHPDRYQWVRVEADDTGALDDVVALRYDGKVIARQVKFSTDPGADDDPWTWEVKKVSKKRNALLGSLLQKWASSIPKLRQIGEIGEASLVSNRRAAPEVQNFLGAEGRVDFDRLPIDIQNQIIEQIGSEREAREFFTTFLFHVDRPNLNVLEDGICRRFLTLGGTDLGWHSLRSELRQWVIRKNWPPPNGAITLPIIRTAAKWYEPKELPQEFEVPHDYTLPSEEFHEEFLADITTATSGCRVLVGRPGLGKSTYLSFVFKQLVERGIPAIRHHYFLSTRERIVGRLDHQRVAESLMSSLQRRYPESLQAHGFKNPIPGELGQWLESSAQYFASQNQALLIIIDGLDHVWREKGSRAELDHLFEHLLPSPEGMVLIVGTQPIDEERLPMRLIQEAPCDQWHELPLLDKRAICTWLSHHGGEFDLSEHEHVRAHVLDRLTDAFWAKSGGHPLHLRYALAALRERYLPTTPESVWALPGSTHEDIERYYNELWYSIPEAGRGILHLLAATRFPWPQYGLLGCLGEDSHDPQINMALRQVRHLLVDDPIGLRAFHSSLLVYVTGRTDHAMYASILKRKALQWLREDAPPYWRWAHEWLLQADLGDNEQLLNGPNRAWAVQAIALRYPSREVAEILGRAAWLALEKQNLARFVETGLLNDYFNLIGETRREVLTELFRAQLWLEEDDHLRQRLHASLDELTDAELVVLARDEVLRGNRQVADLCVEQVSRRLSHHPGEAGLLHQGWKTRLVVLAKLGAVASVDSRRMAKFIGQFEKGEYVEAASDGYASTLRVLRSIQPFRDILVEDLTPVSRLRILRHMVMLALEEGIELSCDDLLRETDPYTYVYAQLRQIDMRGRVVASPSLLGGIAPDDFRSHQASAASFFHAAFFFFLAHHLAGSTAGREWVGTISGEAWIREMATRLELIAFDVSSGLAKQQPVDIELVYRRIKGVPRPSWIHDRDNADLAAGFEWALREIALDLLSMNGTWSEHPQLHQQDLEVAFGTDYCDRWSFISAYLTHERLWMTNDAVAWVLKTSEAELDATVNEFTTRSTRFATLAALASLHEMTDEARRLVRRAAENVLAYGDHKDLLLDSVLEIVRECHQVGIGRSKSWLLQLAPAIASIEDFTDGDETNHLPRTLGEVLVQVVPNRLPDYYQWLCAEEEYYDASSVFHSFLSSADLSDELNQSLARTAIDDESLAILRERANQGDMGATSALADIECLLGPPADSQTEDEDREMGPKPVQADEVPDVDPMSYRPPALMEYIEAAGARYPYDRERLAYGWLETWKNAGYGSAAFDAVAALVESDGGPRANDRLFELAKTFCGREAAYPWLVRAHRAAYSWTRFFTRKADAVRRWEMVKQHYPNRWFQFIVDSFVYSYGEPWERLTVNESVLRLVEYCIFMGQYELTVEIADQAVISTLELVSPACLPMPEWVDAR